MTPTAGNASAKSASHARVMPPSPIASEDLVDEAALRQQPAPHDAGSDERDDLGQEEHRSRGRAQCTRRDPPDERCDEQSERPPGCTLKKMISLNAFAIDPTRSGSVRTLT